MRWVTGEDVATTEQAAAEFIAAELGRSIRERGRATLAVSGGRTPWGMFGRLAALELEWTRIHLFQADERIAPANDAARNWTQFSATTLLARIPVAQRHPMPVEIADARVAADRYAASLAAACGEPAVLDVVHLGLGDDGHTASLFAGDALLGENARDVGVSGPHAGLCRLSLTLPALNRARCVVWLALGAGRQRAVARLFAADRTMPASLVARERATAFTDPEAAP
jgi:6-phosphogluconolactonase